MLLWLTNVLPFLSGATRGPLPLSPTPLPATLLPSRPPECRLKMSRRVQGSIYRLTYEICVDVDRAEVILVGDDKDDLSWRRGGRAVDIETDKNEHGVHVGLNAVRLAQHRRHCSQSCSSSTVDAAGAGAAAAAPTSDMGEVFEPRHAFRGNRHNATILRLTIPHVGVRACSRARGEKHTETLTSSVGGSDGVGLKGSDEAHGRALETESGARNNSAIVTVTAELLEGHLEMEDSGVSSVKFPTMQLTPAPARQPRAPPAPAAPPASPPPLRVAKSVRLTEPALGQPAPPTPSLTSHSPATAIMLHHTARTKSLDSVPPPTRTEPETTTHDTHSTGNPTTVTQACSPRPVSWKETLPHMHLQSTPTVPTVIKSVSVGGATAEVVPQSNVIISRRSRSTEPSRHTHRLRWLSVNKISVIVRSGEIADIRAAAATAEGVANSGEPESAGVILGDAEDDGGPPKKGKSIVSTVGSSARLSQVGGAMAAVSSETEVAVDGVWAEWSPALFFLAGKAGAMVRMGVGTG